MLKSNQIDGKLIFIGNTRMKFVESPVYINVLLIIFSSPRSKLFFCCNVVFLLHIFISVVNDCSAGRGRLEVVDAQEHSWVRTLEVWEL